MCRTQGRISMVRADNGYLSTIKNIYCIYLGALFWPVESTPCISMHFLPAAFYGINGRFHMLNSRFRVRWILLLLMASCFQNLLFSKPVLEPLTLAGIADFIKSGRCKSIFCLTGAGVSTGAGIPDFRSPGGMYDSLRPELLTATEKQKQMMRADPVHVVTREMFFQNQFPYMEVRRPFILGVQSQQWKATLSHWFMKLGLRPSVVCYPFCRVGVAKLFFFRVPWFSP